MKALASSGVEAVASNTGGGLAGSRCASVRGGSSEGADLAERPAACDDSRQTPLSDCTETSRATYQFVGSEARFTQAPVFVFKV